jgi:hypothetical protein
MLAQRSRAARARVLVVCMALGAAFPVADQDGRRTPAGCVGGRQVILTKSGYNP